MPRCQKCNAEIASGRSLCELHYLEEMEIYKADLIDYQHQMDQWQNMSDDDKQSAHTDLEEWVITRNSVIVGILLSIFVAFFINQEIKGQPIIGLIIGIITFLPFILVRPFKIFVGRFTRVVVYSLFICAVSWLPLWFMIELLFKENVNQGYAVGIFVNICTVIFLFYREITGGAHANARPKKPTKPHR